MKGAVLTGLAAVGAGALAFGLGRLAPAACPQAVSGGDVLSVVLGDAKKTLSRAMVHQADSYFHGGVDVACAECHDPAYAHGHHEHRKPRAAGEADEGAAPAPAARFDPWRWINVHVRAPEVERHLEAEKSVELMPWLWVSVRADPHNIEAWTTAWFTADGGLHDRALALRILAEGRAKNPDSLELELCEGRTYFAHGKGDLAAARRVFASVRDRALARCGGDVEALAENDRWMLRFARNYLAECDRRLDPSR